MKQPEKRRLTPGETTIAKALARLRRAEKERRRAIEELVRLGAIRSKGLVGDLGEAYAALYYGGAELAPPSTPGYDLVTADGRRVQVKTLVCRDYLRGTINWMGEPYDVLFAIRLDADYEPIEAIEAPREAVEAHYGHGRVRWGRAFVADPRVRPHHPVGACPAVGKGTDEPRHSGR